MDGWMENIQFMTRSDSAMLKEMAKNKIKSVKHYISDSTGLSWLMKVHDSTVIKRLNKYGFFGRIVSRKSLPSKKNTAAQLRFAKLHLNNHL